MSLIARVADKAGFLGSLVSAMGCASCFPAIASLGAAIGLGFLSQYEGLFIRILIPIFALIALLANLAGWWSHRQWQRALTGSIGPILVLIGALGLMGVFGMTPGFLAAGVARGVFYAGLIVMFLAAVWDLINPANRRCRTDGGALSTKHR